MAAPRDVHPGRTALCIAGALLVLESALALVSPRSRATADARDERVEIAEHEPPTSPLVAPRPAPSSRTAAEGALHGRIAAREAADAGPAGPASTKHARELAAVELRVTRDGRPAPFASVELAREGAPPELHAADERGALALELPPGDARAVAWSDDACALPARATLVAGERALLELALEPAYPVAGRVVDAQSGAPLAGARVSLWTFAERDEVITAADGTFLHPRFPARAPAQQVAARADGYGVDVRYLRIDGNGVWRLPARARGEAGESGTGTPWVELALAPELVVRGRVLDERGRPLAGARVSAEGFFHALASVASRDGAEARSGADGGFVLAGLRSDIGHALSAEGRGRASAPREIEAGTTELEVELVLAPACALAGNVLGADGLPVADAEVVLRVERDEPAPAVLAPLDAGARVAGSERRARTDALGAFVFDGLEPLPCVLSVEHEGGLAELALAPRADGTFASPCLALAPPAPGLYAAER